MTESLSLIWRSSVSLEARVVEVMLPESWRTAACPPGRQPPASASSSSSPPDLVLVGKAGAVPAGLQSIQPAGCGRKGLGVNLPVNLLLNYLPTLTTTNLNHTDNTNITSTSSTSSTNNLASSLAIELVNSRYGSYVSSDQDLSVFSLEEEADYSPAQPTNHNIICQGRNPAHMVPHLINNNNTRNSNNNTMTYGHTVPEFRYVVREEQHYVVVLDQTNTAGWASIKRSFYRLINSLKEGTMLTIITFGSEASLVLPPDRKSVV